MASDDGLCRLCGYACYPPPVELQARLDEQAAEIERLKAFLAHCVCRQYLYAHPATEHI